MKCYIIILLNTVVFSQSTQTTKIAEISKFTAFETLEKLADEKESNRYLGSLVFASLGSYALIVAADIDQDDYYLKDERSQLKKLSYINFGMATYYLIFQSTAEVELKKIKKSDSDSKNEMAYQKLNALANKAKIWRYVDVAASGIAAYYFYANDKNDGDDENNGKTISYLFLTSMVFELFVPSAEERYFNEYEESHKIESSLSFNPFQNKSIQYRLSMNF